MNDLIETSLPTTTASCRSKGVLTIGLTGDSGNNSYGCSVTSFGAEIVGVDPTLSVLLATKKFEVSGYC
ncbi:MAG: hypothetical protein HYZ43_06110 [Flavobacteriia bacterium]|nr:hypothetical protein [Flavobacteriia bacterium]